MLRTDGLVYDGRRSFGYVEHGATRNETDRQMNIGQALNAGPGRNLCPEGRAMNRPVDGLVRPPSSYEEYLLLSEKDKLRLMRQSKKTKRPNA